MTVKISVVIPTFNRREYLLECLTAIRSQRVQPFEVIVVDDGSTDGTQDELATRNDLTLLKQENSGPGAARNLGASKASGDYFAFLDSDDLWLPWTIEVISAILESHGRPPLLFGKYEDFKGYIGSVEEAATSVLEFQDLLASTCKGHFFAGAGMMVIERGAFAATGGFVVDRLNAEDHDLALELGVAKGFVQIVEPTTILHRVHRDNESNDLIKSARGIERLILKEKRNRYPGGAIRRFERRRLISAHSRPVIVELLKSKDVELAWRLFSETLIWQLRGWRFRFLGWTTFKFLTLLIEKILRSLSRERSNPEEKSSSESFRQK